MDFELEDVRYGPTVEGLSHLLITALDEGDLTVPPLSGSVVELLETVREPDFRMERVVRVVEHDPALAAHVLRVANSALYSPVVEIASLRDAAARLGARAISDVALALLLKQQVFQGGPREQERVRAMWRHSSVTATFARELGRVVEGRGQESLLLGLLHDVGRPVLVALLDQVEGEVGGALPRDVYDGVLEELHGEVGALLVRNWGLPARLEAAVAWHHDYAQAEDHRSAAMLTHLACRLGHSAEGESDLDADSVASLPVVGDLGLPESAVRDLLARSGELLDSATSL